MIPSHQTKVCVLLFSFTFFWCWQIVQPVLDGHLPSISITHTNLTLPISEVASQYLGAATILSGYALYFTLNYGDLSFVMNVAFMLAAFMVASGHGVHVACVTIQNQMTAQNSLHKLVYFLHEHYSHHTFLIGFYGLVFLLIWTERNSSKRPQVLTSNTKLPTESTSHKQRSSDSCNGRKPRSESTAGASSCTHNRLSTSVQECKQLSSLSKIHKPPTKVSQRTTDCSIHNIGTISGHNDMNTDYLDRVSATQAPLQHKLQSKSDGIGEKLAMAITLQEKQFSTQLARLIVLWTTRVWPVFVGVYFSVFASMTSTKPLTTLFYFGVLSSQMMLYKKLPFNGLADFLNLLDNDLVIGGFFTKAVLVGLPLMFLDFE